MFKSIFSKKQIDSLNACYNAKTNQLALAYKYVALVTHTNLVPTNAVVLENNFNQILTISRTGVGTYDITVTGNVFDLNKTVYSVTNNHSYRAFFNISWISTSTLRLQTFYDNALVDELLWKVPLTISVYK